MAEKKNLPKKGENITAADAPAREHGIDPLNKINIDGVEYDFTALPDEAKALIRQMRFADQEVSRLQGMTAILLESRQNCGTRLSELLHKPGKKQ